MITNLNEQCSSTDLICFKNGEITKIVKDADEQESLLCFTIMPFGSKGEYDGKEKESDYVYQHFICTALKDASKRISKQINSIREVDRCLPGSITKNIIKTLASADFVIADITGRNPNVFLELGIRYALCPSNTILLRQEIEEIPFDISNFKVILYDKYKPTEGSLNISEYLVNSFQTPNIDSPVFDSIHNLEIYGDGIKKIGSLSQKSEIEMSWEEIMGRLNSLSFYKEHYKSGSFSPDALIGISNGGMIMAEIISRKYFHRVPVICLWADRWSAAGLKDSSSHFFTNKFARASIQPLKELKEQKNYLTLLLIDDNVSSGTTCKYAIRFLKDELGEDTKIVFQPIVCKVESYLSSVEEVLPPNFSEHLFKLNKANFIEAILTEKSKFPYDKDIRG